MKKIIVGSTNAVKSEAALKAFGWVFPNEQFEAQNFAAASAVPAQPFGDGQTLEGATNRAQAAFENNPDADYWVGLEGGLGEGKDGQLQMFAWAVVRDRTRVNSARTATCHLPPPLCSLIRSGLELGDADDRFFGRQNSKYANGSVGILTDNVIDRVHYYAHALVLALVPFKHPEWYR